MDIFLLYWMMQQAQPQLCNALHYGQKLFDNGLYAKLKWDGYVIFAKIRQNCNGNC